MHAKNYHDLGTPAADGESVTLDIDGATVTVPAGTSIMRAAALIGTDVPKLCATDTLEAFGSCRLCLVEIDGRNGYPASCTTPVADGMVVRTQTDRLAKLRRGVMELYISDHPLDCLTCSAMAIANCRNRPALWACAMSAMAMRGKTTSSPTRMRATRISPSIPPNASSARAACALATRSRVRSR